MQKKPSKKESFRNLLDQQKKRMEKGEPQAESDAPEGGDALISYDSILEKQKKKLEEKRSSEKSTSGKPSTASGQGKTSSHPGSKGGHGKATKSSEDMLRDMVSKFVDGGDVRVSSPHMPEEKAPEGPKIRPPKTPASTQTKPRKDFGPEKKMELPKWAVTLFVLVTLGLLSAIIIMGYRRYFLNSDMGVDLSSIRKIVETSKTNVSAAEKYVSDGGARLMPAFDLLKETLEALEVSKKKMDLWDQTDFGPNDKSQWSNLRADVVEQLEGAEKVMASCKVGLQGQAGMLFQNCRNNGALADEKKEQAEDFMKENKIEDALTHFGYAKDEYIKAIDGANRTLKYVQFQDIMDEILVWQKSMQACDAKIAELKKN